MRSIPGLIKNTIKNSSNPQHPCQLLSFSLARLSRTLCSVDPDAAMADGGQLRAENKKTLLAGPRAECRNANAPLSFATGGRSCNYNPTIHLLGALYTRTKFRSHFLRGLALAAGSLSSSAAEGFPPLRLVPLLSAAAAGSAGSGGDIGFAACETISDKLAGMLESMGEHRCAKACLVSPAFKGRRRACKQAIEYIVVCALSAHFVRAFA